VARPSAWQHLEVKLQIIISGQSELTKMGQDFVARILVGNLLAQKLRLQARWPVGLAPTCHGSQAGTKKADPCADLPEKKLMEALHAAASRLLP
jgi:hypothetical protein